ncbi:UNVERIFIED_CONTAM: hypothetical protein FKN15_055993 [Acipenser sinensis]
MDFKELIAMINRNTAVQVEQNKTWRLELGLPEREPTELDLLLQKWEVELPSREPEEELPLPEPRGEELLLPEPRGEEPPRPEPRGEKPPLPEPRGEEAKSIPPPQPRPPPLETSPALLDAVSWPGLVGPLGGMPGPPSSCPSSQVTGLPGTVACLVPHSAPPNGTDVTKWESDVACAPPSPTLFPLRPQSSLRRSIGAHLCLPFLAPGRWSAKWEVELPSREPEEELPLPEPRGEELPLPELKGEEAKSIPPPQPRPPPLETSPVLLDAVSWPGLVGPLGRMPGPPSSCPSSQVTGLPGTVACLVPHSAPPNGTDVTTWESDVACAPPSPTLFPHFVPLEVPDVAAPVPSDPLLPVTARSRSPACVSVAPGKPPGSLLAGSRSLPLRTGGGGGGGMWPWNGRSVLCT